MISPFMPSSAEESFYPSLLNWYLLNARDLPWRATKNPYHIWLSEVILQQTRVNQGLPYYLKFLNAYPTLPDLANASADEVLRLWQGLGYYSRARNMHNTAKFIVENFDGVFPNNYNGLLQLKGIGPYTAAAIASFAYNEAVPVVDGNVFRVLARYFGMEQDISAPKARKVFEEVAQRVLINSKADECNQAIMEFGALHCKPQKPLCSTCPLSEHCVALKLKMVEQLPVKTKKLVKRNRYLYYLLPPFEEIEKGEKSSILMKKRASADVWKGLYEFPLLELEGDLSQDMIAPKVKEFLGTNDDIKLSFSKIYKHQLTHQQLFIRFIKLKSFSSFQHFIVKLTTHQDFKPYSLQEIEDLPKPIILANYLNDDYRSYIGCLFDD